MTMNKRIVQLTLGLTFFLISTHITLSQVYADDSYNISLRRGENLIALPLILQDPDIQSVLSPIITRVKDVWRFDPSETNSPWKHYQPGLEEYSSLREMNATVGYWVDVKYNTTLQITGVPVPEHTTLNFKQGWNIIGWPYQYSQEITEALCGLIFGVDYDQVSTFNRQTKVQEDFINDPGSDDFTSFEPTKAYYIYMLKDKTIKIGLPSENEPNDDFTTATLTGLNSPITGAINPNEDNDYFKITTTQSGKIYLSLTNLPSNIDAYVYLYDSNHSQIAHKYSGGYGNSINLEKELPSPGNYYICILDNDNNDSSVSPYTLSVNFTTLWISSVSDSPDPFSPNQDTIKDTTTISATLTGSADWSVKIKNEANTTVKTFTGTGANIEVIWDGKNEQGQLFPDGTYTYYINAHDPITGVDAQEVGGTVVIDTTPPIGTITINNDAEYTNSTEVSLTLSAQDNSGGSGIDQMQFSNDNINWTTSEDYATTKSWTLTSGDGTKTVYVKFKDKAGNWSDTVSDTIILDTQPPQITEFQPSSWEKFYEGETVLISATLNDQDPSPSEYQFSIDGEIVQAWSSNSSHSWITDSSDIGDHQIKIEGRDIGGEDTKEVSVYILRGPIEPPQ